MSVTAPVTARQEALPAVGWLRGRDFDLLFMLGIVAVAWAAAWVVIRQPALLVPFVLADQWLLGYHHVIATFTRLCFDRESLAAHRFLVFVLPVLVVAGVVAAVATIGVWTLPTTYFYWQWFHYARQSWGVAQVYRRKAGGRADDQQGWLFQVAFYLLPVWGVLHRSFQNPGEFLGMELRVVPVPGWLVDACGIAAAIAFAWWIAGRAVAYARGTLPPAHTLYLLSHFAVFYVGYLVIDDITAGWLAVNIWHNAQYVMFVWMFNNNRFKAGIDPKARFLSTISQSNKVWLYFVTCLAISTMVYRMLDSAVGALPLLLLMYQVANFHHYIADAVIWKVRRKSLQQTLGLTA